MTGVTVVVVVVVTVANLFRLRKRRIKAKSDPPIRRPRHTLHGTHPRPPPPPSPPTATQQSTLLCYELFLLPPPPRPDRVVFLYRRGASQAAMHEESAETIYFEENAAAVVLQKGWALLFSIVWPRCAPLRAEQGLAQDLRGAPLYLRHGTAPATSHTPSVRPLLLLLLPTNQSHVTLPS